MHPLDTAPAVRSTVVRKSIACSLRVPRAVRRLLASREDFLRYPPVVVNSIPKSGTHLLLQVARKLPDGRYYGSFMAWAASFRLKARTVKQIQVHIGKIAPGEVVGAHLLYSPAIETALETINAVHLLIVRNPVDVLLSEVHYLTRMNPFHRMAREFRGKSASEGVDLALKGSSLRPDLYPDFSERLSPYIGWLLRPSVHIVRYERLVSDSERRLEIEGVVRAWRKRAQSDCDIESVVNSAMAAICPQRSHTNSNRKKEPELERALALWLFNVRRGLGYV